MRHLVLGTAGHIDHGKSALVRALTGTDPDRLKEEQRRGITIELGFADLAIDEERGISFVDVPGHERFVRHMVAGATGIDAVLLVVAADQGVQPQTREHLEICSLLGLRHGIVALTKCDLVDQELSEVATLEVRELLTGTFLEEAPLIPVSAKAGQGLDELGQALSALFERIAPRRASGVPRLPVDRSFVLRGFGSVVTGTLSSGTFQEGAEVEVLPGERRGRIRGLQVHGSGAGEVPAGRRTAVNLQGLDCDDVPRGSTVTLPGALATTRRIWARIELLPSAPKGMERGGPVRFHQGTCERGARFRRLGQGDDGAMHAEIYLGAPTVLCPGDRFVLRRPAPVDTVGGGTVVDIDPPHARDADPSAFAMKAIELDIAVGRRLGRAGDAGAEPARLAPVLGRTIDELEQSAASLEKEGKLLRRGARWFDGESWRAREQDALDRLERFHAAEPLSIGLSREALRVQACPDMSQDAWRRLLEGLAERGDLRLDGELVALVGHEVVLSDADTALSERVDRRFREAGLEPPTVAEVRESEDPKRLSKIVDLLIARGRLVRIHDGKLFHGEALAELREKLRAHAARSRTIDVAEFKKLAGVTRKHAIPLLEHLDAERTTRRLGNQREIILT